MQNLDKIIQEFRHPYEMIMEIINIKLGNHKIIFYNEYLKLTLFRRSYLTKKVFVFEASTCVIKFEYFNTHALTGK